MSNYKPFEKDKMNIEEGIIKAKTILNNHREIDKMMVIEMVELVETLLKAYEKEKEKNKKINKYIEDRAKIGKNIQTFINKDYVEQEYISKDKIKEIIYGDYEDLEIILKIKQLID